MPQRAMAIAGMAYNRFALFDEYGDTGGFWASSVTLLDHAKKTARPANAIKLTTRKGISVARGFRDPM